MALTPGTIVAPLKSLISRQVGEDFLLVPLCASADKIDYFYTLNQVGTDIWKLLDGVKTLAETVDELAQQYDADRETIAKEVFEFLRELLDAGMIEIVDDAHN